MFSDNYREIEVNKVAEPIKCQCYPHIETSQLNRRANQFTGFYEATLVLNG